MTHEARLKATCEIWPNELLIKKNANLNQAKETI